MIDGNKQGETPPPGSDAAVAAGCTCPVFDNAKGKGLPGGMYWINSGCPLHGTHGYVREERSEDD